MSEHVDVESSEMALFLLECDRRRGPWELSFLDEGLLLGALPQGSGGSDEVGELENTSAPCGLHLKVPCVGMGTLGDTVRTGEGAECGEVPRGTSTQRGSSSSRHNVSDGGLMQEGLWLPWTSSKAGSSSRMSWLRFSSEISRSGASRGQLDFDRLSLTASCDESMRIV